jgi:hypothetical protein
MESTALVKRAKLTMTAAKRVPAVRDLCNVIALLFGGPFVGIVLVIASNFFHGWLDWGLTSLGGLILVVYVQSVKRVGLTKAFLILLGWVAVFLAFSLVVRGLASLASGGTFLNGHSSHTYVDAQLCITASVVWLVIGVPYRAFRIRLDPDGKGYAQAALLGALASTAAALTGVNILMLHFAGGPLRSPNGAVLTVGIIFTILVVVPIYRFVATACWKYGFRGIFSPGRIIERWREMLPELQVARDRAAEPDLKLDPASPRLDESRQGTASATPANSGNALTAATTSATTRRSTSSGRAVGGKAARRARKKARKAGGIAGS